jgi:hypothetical protein
MPTENATSGIRFMTNLRLRYVHSFIDHNGHPGIIFDDPASSG